MSRSNDDRRFKLNAMQQISDMAASLRDGIKAEYMAKLKIKLEAVETLDEKNVVKEQLVGRAIYDDMEELERDKKIALDLIADLDKFKVTKMVNKYGAI